MDFRKERLSITEAKDLDMVNYLSASGFEPAKIRGADHWYHSPLRDERTPSFKVNRNINRWYDYGLGQGGNLVDFGVVFYQCTVGEFLKKLNGDSPFQQPLIRHEAIPYEPKPKIEIREEFLLSSAAIIGYLKERRIPIEVAGNYCLEVRYELNEKIYYGIGFRNDSGGFEIRNPYIKLSSPPKDVTTLKNGADKAVVFEGFMDFLSFLTVHKDLQVDSYDFVILNSLSFFERVRPFMEAHQEILLYLDRDTAGMACTTKALSLNSKYADHSNLYENHKDLNEWVVNFGKSAKVIPAKIKTSRKLR